MSVYLITGATGSLGTKLTRTLLSQGHKVRAYARNEHSHERLQKELPQEHLPRLSSLLGSVENRDRLRTALEGVEYVIHAAAQKVIPLCEYNPSECIQTNVIGSENVFRACMDTGVRRAVLVSTDKASAPCTTYGKSKALAESLWLNANRYSAGKEPHFVAVRYGNVWGSQGSVLHAWTKQAQYGSVEITDPQCTRFHIKLDQAIAFVLEALHVARAGELWVPRLPSYRLGDLAHAFRQVYGLEKQPSITGLRLSEKLHESMISVDESSSLKSEEDLHYTLEPGVIHRKQGFQYTSGQNEWRLGVEALKSEIQEWAGK